jgi:hypothetical protein
MEQARVPTPVMLQLAYDCIFAVHWSKDMALIALVVEAGGGLAIHPRAAAIAGNADAIVTCNPKDFPASVLAPCGIEALHSDTFIRQFVVVDPSAVLSGTRTCFGRLINPPIGVAAYLKNLQDVNLLDTAAFADGKLP